MHQAWEVITDVTMIGSSMAARRRVKCDQDVGEKEAGGTDALGASGSLS